MTMRNLAKIMLLLALASVTLISCNNDNVEPDGADLIGLWNLDSTVYYQTPENAPDDPLDQKTVMVSTYIDPCCIEGVELDFSEDSTNLNVTEDGIIYPYKGSYSYDTDNESVLLDFGSSNDFSKSQNIYQLESNYSLSYPDNNTMVLFRSASDDARSVEQYLYFTKL